MSTCRWPLGNGQTLTFHVYDSNDKWLKAAGLYIFAYLAKDGLWRALYVGQTDDFSSRLPSHERLDEAIQHGATHIHAVQVPLAANRDEWERLLISHLQPQLNELYRNLNRFAY
jgi:hypothetical protein